MTDGLHFVLVHMILQLERQNLTDVLLVNSLYIFFTQFVKVIPLIVAAQVIIQFAKQDRAAHVGVVCERRPL